MVTFPHLGNFYTNTDVTAIKSRSSKHGVILETAPFDPEQGKKDPKGGDRRGGHTGPATRTETYDDMVMCILADDAKKLLGKTATWRERFVLGGAHFFDDITITHSDSEYFSRNHETAFKDSLCAAPRNEQQEAQIAFARNETEKRQEDGEPAGYRPMYYTHSYKEDMKKIEMAFDVTNYQHQFRQTTPNSTTHTKPSQPYNAHIFQSIFLDKSHSDLWTADQIDPDKILLRKWWHQLGHRWQHYVRVVPGMMWINGTNRTWYAGSWTLVNMHEMACVSGIAAAWRLGAEYVVFDDFAEDLFRKYLLISHGKIYRGGRKEE